LATAEAAEPKTTQLEAASIISAAESSMTQLGSCAYFAGDPVHQQKTRGQVKPRVFQSDLERCSNDGRVRLSEKLKAWAKLALWVCGDDASSERWRKPKPKPTVMARGRLLEQLRLNRKRSSARG
jgi:hypothetical protein